MTIPEQPGVTTWSVVQRSGDRVISVESYSTYEDAETVRAELINDAWAYHGGRWNGGTVTFPSGVVVSITIERY